MISRIRSEFSRSFKETHKTKELKNLISHYFTVDEVMRLVSEGADPDVTDNYGRPLLHKLVDLIFAYPSQLRKCFLAIIDLIDIYRADPDVLDFYKLSPILRLFVTDYYSNQNLLYAFRIQHDNPNHVKENYDSLKNVLIKNEQLSQIYLHGKLYETTIQPLKTNYLNFLILLSHHIYGSKSESPFSKLPVDVLLYIVKFFDFTSMKKTTLDGYLLAQHFLKENTYHNNIKPMLKQEGGINIFQEKVQFTFFNSAHTLALDYTNKVKLTSEKSVDKKFKSLALPYWEKHSALFQKPINKDKLLLSIVHSDLYSKPAIRKKLPMKREEFYSPQKPY